MFIIGYIETYIFGSKCKDHEGKFLPNMIIVINTDICENRCLHIHYWIFLLFILIIFISLNYIIGNKPNIYYIYLLFAYLGAFISEYIRYGNDILKLYKNVFLDVLCVFVINIQNKL